MTMSSFVCPVADCPKELSRLQVMHFRSKHDCDPFEWVENQYGAMIQEMYDSGMGSYAIASEYEWLSPDMVCRIVETRTPQEALTGEINPMKRDGVIEQFTGEENPAKSRAVRDKISKALTGHTMSEEAKRKISKKNSGNNVSPEHREKIAQAASNRDTSYMQTEQYRNALSKALQGREPTYPTPYEVDSLSHHVRSSWEEDVAKLLIDNDIDYEYEREFELSIGSYYPDFLVGTVVIEVKGFSTERSIEKASAFREEYPNYTYLVIGDEIPCDVHISWENRSEMLEVLEDE